MKKHYVIIGSSAAGIAAAGTLRRLDNASSIICLTADKHLPYNRCLLADVLAQAKTSAAISLKPDNFFKEREISLTLATRVEHIDSDTQHVICSDGKRYGYDALFIGTGKSVYLPPIPGITAHGVFQFYDLIDVEKVQKYLKKNTVKHAVIIGAGLTGLECADALGDQVEQVSIIERAAHVLPQQINSAGAQFLQKLAERAGVHVYTDTSVSEICSRDNQVTGVALVGGASLECQLVIMATGNKINSQVARDGGIEVTDHGIVTSQTMQTSHPTIFAGGDVCQVSHRVFAYPINSSLWPDAVAQGIVAATNMVGKSREYQGVLPVTSSNIFGITFVTCMPDTLNDTIEMRIDITDEYYHTYFTDKSGVLVGFIMVGNVQQLGKLRTVVVEKKPLCDDHS